MSEKKQRHRSFRKLFPNLFQSRIGAKDDKNKKTSSFKGPENNDENRNINCDYYENLSILSDIEIISDNTISFNSSSSTLVGNGSTKLDNYPKIHVVALPQVPPKPLNSDDGQNIGFPNVYYHSLEKLNDKVLPNNIMKDDKINEGVVTLTGVGAEIRKVSTKFLISPKKESEVRTNLPKRAKSLDKVKSYNPPHDIVLRIDENKPYTYSAPTSPVSTYHKIPSMPGATSPYDTVRKAINDSETKGNSLRKSETPPPVASYTDRTHYRSITPTSARGSSLETISSHSKKSHQDVSDKEKTKQNVEAFYWKKLKELKIKEDDLLKKSLIRTNEAKNSTRGKYVANQEVYIHSGSLNSRESGVAKGNLNEQISKTPFVRGSSERVTDSFIYTHNDSIVYRRKSELYYDQTPKHNSLNVEKKNYRRNILKSQRVSYEDEFENVTDNNRNFSAGVTSINKATKLPNEQLRPVKVSSPPLPRPPVRTSSVRSPMLKDRIKPIHSKPIEYAKENLPIVGAESNTKSQIQQDGNTTYSTTHNQNDWHADGSRQDGGASDGEAGRGHARGRSSRRDDPRRHTLAGNHLYLHHHHPGHFNSHPMEPPLPGNCQPHNAMLFDDDPGIMSEVETSSTGFRRGGKQRSSLPVVRTPSKTLERPLGLVFLQYRSETKRALLPNEITSIDTVKALFVRSFPKQLSMQYMDSPLVKIYIHDSSKDMFYELEDLRAHLREIRDRSVLRLFEATDISGGVFPGSVGVGTLTMPPPSAAACAALPPNWDQDQNYFSEPEIDSEYHHQHVHKSKVKAPAYYMGTPAPSTLPRGSSSLLRAYSPAAPPVPADRTKSMPGPDGYMSSPERSRGPYEDPYYTQYLGPSRSNITPIIDEESSEGVLEDGYQMYGASASHAPRPMPRNPYDRVPPVEEMQRLRVEKMERQLANLTGLVQKALQVPGAPPAPAHRHDFHATFTRPVSQDVSTYGSVDRPPKLGKDKFQKSVSFEKSVSFSDDPPDMKSPKQHSPQHAADTKPTKPAIKSSTLPRTSSQERDRLKPAPPPKPVGLVSQQMPLAPLKPVNISVSGDYFTRLGQLQNQSRDLLIETRNLRRSTLSHANQMRQMIAEAIVKIGSLAANACEDSPEMKWTREEEVYRQEMLLLENDLYELEATVERLRGQAANREARVNVDDVERIALVLSRSSKTVSEWKLQFPVLQDAMKARLAAEMDKVVRKEKQLEEEPERLELALRRCKKLTGTLVTLKRLACVQEQQRLPLSEGQESPTSSQSSTFCSTAAHSSDDLPSDTNNSHLSAAPDKGSDGRVNGAGDDLHRPENALDALLDELQTFSNSGGGEKTSSSGGSEGGLRRLHSYPSGSDTDASPPVRARGVHPPKPPVPERHPELAALAGRRAPPPPPPRTTSRSPLASPTATATAAAPPDADAQQTLLEQRHRDLLLKQKALQEQYARLQMIQRSGPILPATIHPDLKKTGSESNLLTKMNLSMATAALSGSMTHLAGAAPASAPAPTGTTTNKVYETDIL